jgi:hydrogenase/urease accessory protein HupE
MIRWLAALLLALGAALPLAADTLRPAYVELTQVDAAEWRLVWTLPVQADLSPALEPTLPAGCAISGRVTREGSAAALVSRAAVRCTRAIAGGRIGLTGLTQAQTDVVVRVAPLGRPVQTLRLTPDAPTAAIAERASRWTVAHSYFGIGIDHIVFGYDHLLFVLSFVLLLGRARRIVVAVTAFTVAHSVTLVGTMLGHISLPPAPVESVIALSILFLAVEVLKRDPAAPRLSERAPWVVAFGFGLLHGFGFAGALAQIGLPEGEVPMALLAFNLGVEAGQVAIVVIAAAAHALLRRFAPRFDRPVVRTAAYAIGTVAGIWFIERLLG